MSERLEAIKARLAKDGYGPNSIGAACGDIAYLLAELDKARETNTRLNRRATKAEAFVGKSIEELRGKGLSFGRALANAAATMAEERIRELEAKVAEAQARAWDKGYNKGREDGHDWSVRIGGVQGKPSRNPYRHREAQ